MLDVKKWLMDEMGLSDEDATATAAKIKAENATKLETTIGTHASNLAAQAEIQKTQTALKKANDDLEAEMAEWATLSVKEKAEATELRTSLEAARVRATQLETRLTTLATQHGVDPKSLLEGATIVPEPKAKPVDPGEPDARYVPRDQFNSALEFNLDLPANLQYIRDEHFTLTGKHLDTREIVAKIKANARVKGAPVDPIAIWEEQYKIPTLRTEKAQKDQEALIAAAEARGEERARSAQALPNAAAPGRHAVVFGQRNAEGTVQPRTSALKRPQPGGTLSAAVSAIRSGKYRVDSTRKAG